MAGPQGRHTFWAHVLIDPIFGDNGQHIGFAKVTRDITDKKKAEDELEKAEQALFQSQKLQALGELTGGIAHDFNNLMTVIAGSADFLRRNRDLPEEKKLHYLDGIIETAERATTLTSQLLTFGRRQTVKPRVLNVAKRLASARELLGRTLGSKFSIEVEARDPDIRIEVDEAQFEAAIVNAVVNARDAMPNGGKITLAATTEQDRREFICSRLDYGYGPGDARTGERARLRSVLHDQGGRQGYRPGAVADPRVRGPGWGLGRNSVRRGPRHNDFDVHSAVR